MKQTVKLILDIVMGAVIPILILNNLTRPLGAPTAYVLAALVPVAWVMIDLFFITRKFNFITSYVGLTAIVNGMLAFWFVDGILYAFKDTVGQILATLIFGGSVLLGRPVTVYFLAQALNPDSHEKEAALQELLALPEVQRANRTGTWIVTLQTALAAVMNFFLNLYRVQAPFGSEAFNQQVAWVNGITRLLLPLPAMLALGAALWLVYRALYRQLPSEAGKQQLESDFWDLVRLRNGGELTRT